ncbi:zinc-ribbon domain-containing protein [Falsirhodobacter xinxiangensis]|uniref:zinc-ribbon domain-containing protein n=1 Tax=Falsirhodobacter xinxiangensis TaxID=2530049 RepID=UPI001FECA5BD|nr:zinc-ribbon domain-containing protein [Rhodobacter xinxiangensis]
MRLNCPGCGAQYEVDESAVPEEGRDVQCSACGHGWFQYPPITARPFGAPEPFVERRAPDPEPKPDPMPEPKLEPARPPALNDIRAFLRQEAERETAERRKEGIAAPKPPVQAPETRSAEPPPPAARKPVPPGGARQVARPSEQLGAEPDVAASLRPAPSAKGGFGLGFFATIVLFLLVAGIYVSAPRLADALPELRDPLAQYVSFVDAGRQKLADFARQVSAALRS